MNYIYIIILFGLLKEGDGQSWCEPIQCNLRCPLLKDNQGCDVCQCSTSQDCSTFYCRDDFKCVMERQDCTSLPGGADINQLCPLRPTCKRKCIAENMILGCINQCQRPKSCSNPNPPPVYCSTPCSQSCMCQDGYVMDDVEWSGCIHVSQCKPSCKGHVCPPNHKCEMVTRSCNPPPGVDASTYCPQTTDCISRSDRVCATISCNPRCQNGYMIDNRGCETCQCLPPQPLKSCHDMHCDLNFHCEMRNRQCPDPPPGQDSSHWCLPQPVCLPDNSRCLGVLCPFTCDIGYVKDSQGCDTCECSIMDCTTKRCSSNEICVMEKNCLACMSVAKCKANMNRCPDISGCRLACQNGFEKDNGCDICRCSRKICQSHRCDLNLHCEMQTALCPLAPVGRDASQWCLERPTCVLSNLDCRAVPCNLNCLRGYVRNSLSCDICECVEEHHEIKCQRMFCSGNYECRVIKPCDTCTTQAMCVLNCPKLTCNLACRYGYEAALGCPACKCQRFSCESHRCNLNLHCEMQNSTCPPPPQGRDASQWCLPVPVCVSNGFSRISCRSIPCDRVCNRGYMRDQFGCEICECITITQDLDCERKSCAANHQCRITKPCQNCQAEAKCVSFCPSLNCNLACYMGFEMDKGCHICKCRQSTCKEFTCGLNQRCMLRPPVPSCPFPPEGKNTSQWCLDEAVCIYEGTCPAVPCFHRCKKYAKDSHGCKICQCAKDQPPRPANEANCTETVCPGDHVCKIEKACNTCPAQVVCKFSDSCTALQCSLVCKKGLVKDKNGCEICECVEEKVEATNAANCTNKICPTNHRCEIKRSCETCQGEAVCRSVLNGCPELQCNLACVSGFEIKQGCEICKCGRRTCESYRCDLNQHCTLRRFPCPDPPAGKNDSQWCLPEPLCVYNNHICGGIRCVLNCDNGHQTDEKGCLICKCKEKPEIPKTRDCTTVTCESDERCEMISSACSGDVDENTRKECPPVPTCISSSINKTCQEKNCSLDCKNGYKKDNNNCETCECTEDNTETKCKCQTGEICSITRSCPSCDEEVLCTKNVTSDEKVERKVDDERNVTLDRKGHVDKNVTTATRNNVTTEFNQTTTDNVTNEMNVTSESNVTKNVNVTKQKNADTESECKEIDCDLECNLANDTGGCPICKCESQSLTCDPPCSTTEECVFHNNSCSGDQCDPVFYECVKTKGLDTTCKAAVCPDCNQREYAVKTIDNEGCLTECQCLGFYQFCEFENCVPGKNQSCTVNYIPCKRGEICKEYHVVCRTRHSD